MTLAEVKARVLERLDETATVSLRYTNANVEEYVLDGARFYVARVGNQMTTTTITQVAETFFYDLPCDCIQVTRVLWSSNGRYEPLEPTNTRLLDDQMTLWQRQYATRSNQYFFLGTTQIALWPLSSVGGEEYVVHYKQDAIPAVSNLPVEDHELLVDYAVARCLLADGKAQEATEEYVKYAKGIKAAQRRLGSADRLWQREMI